MSQQEAFLNRSGNGNLWDWSKNNEYRFPEESFNYSLRTSPKPAERKNDYLHKKFSDTVDEVGGTFKIKKDQSSLLMTFYKIKLDCNSGRFKYNAIVIGDEFEDEDEARRNIFLKAYRVLQFQFGKQLRMRHYSQSQE